MSFATPRDPSPAVDVDPVSSMTRDKINSSDVRADEALFDGSALLIALRVSRMGCSTCGL